MGKNSRNRNKNNQSAPAETDKKNALINVNEAISNSSLARNYDLIESKLKRIEQLVEKLTNTCDELRGRCSAYEYMLFDGVNEFEHEIVPPPIEFSDDYKEDTLSVKEEEVQVKHLSDEEVEELIEQIDQMPLRSELPEKIKNPSPVMDVDEESEKVEEGQQNDDDVSVVVYRKIYANEARRDFGTEAGLDTEIVDYYLFHIIRDLDLLNNDKSFTEMECINKLQEYYQEDALEFFSKVEEIYTKYGEKATNFPSIEHWFEGFGAKTIGTHAYTHLIRTGYSTIKFNKLRDEVIQKCPHYSVELSEEPLPFAELLGMVKPPQKLELEHKNYNLKDGKIERVIMDMQHEREKFEEEQYMDY